MSSVCFSQWCEEEDEECKELVRFHCLIRVWKRRCAWVKEFEVEIYCSFGIGFKDDTFPFSIGFENLKTLLVRLRL